MSRWEMYWRLVRRLFNQALDGHGMIYVGAFLFLSNLALLIVLFLATPLIPVIAAIQSVRNRSKNQ